MPEWAGYSCETIAVNGARPVFSAKVRALCPIPDLGKGEPMITPKNLDELTLALVSLRETSEAIDDLRASLSRPERPADDCTDAVWESYRVEMGRFYGQKDAYDAAYLVLIRKIQLLTDAWDYRHVRAPAQLAARRAADKVQR